MTNAFTVPSVGGTSTNLGRTCAAGMNSFGRLNDAPQFKNMQQSDLMINQLNYNINPASLTESDNQLEEFIEMPQPNMGTQLTYPTQLNVLGLQSQELN